MADVTREWFIVHRKQFLVIDRNRVLIGKFPIKTLRAPVRARFYLKLPYKYPVSMCRRNIADQKEVCGRMAQWIVLMTFTSEIGVRFPVSSMISTRVVVESMITCGLYYPHESCSWPLSGGR